VFAAVDDIARETAETEGEFSAKVKKSANGDQKAAEEKQCAPEFAERVHPRILPETSEKPSPSTPLLSTTLTHSLEMFTHGCAGN
jgi:hypothetical protein